MREVSASLNDAQKQAVAHKAGPLMVVAGAGTGKTRVIVERMLKLLEDGVKPDSILALTFTEKAAGEMLDRINASRGGVTLDMTIATYNGFGDEILKAYAAEIGLGNLRLLGETGQLVFLREHLDDFNLDYFAPVAKPDSQLSLLADYISLLKQQLVQPDEYLTYVAKMPHQHEGDKLEKTKHQELAGFYKTYLELCRTNQVIDYDDQLFLTIELLRKRPNITRELQKRYRYILVDEFQDTNPMQSALLDLLAHDGQNIMVVGDDDQSIYGWRGATLANILEFKQRYPKSKEVTLIENYRSTQSILDSAYKLIQYNNPDRLEIINNLDKRLRSHSGEGQPPVVKHFTNLDSELAWVAEDIAARIKAGQDPATIAVLARRNQVVQKAHESLELHGVPHAVAGLQNDLYQQVSVNQLVEALKAINDPLDDLALYHTLGGPLFNLPSAELSILAGSARRNYIALSDVIKASDNEAASEALQQLENWRDKAASQSVGDMAYQVITDSGWKRVLYTQAESDPEIEQQVQALGQFFKTLKEFERIAGIASLQHYLLNLPALRAAGNELQDASLDISDTLVNVLSVHRAKGLEWETVFIIDCTEGSFPMRNFGGGLQVPEELKIKSRADDKMSEERRLMYVAATRARQELYLSYADTHTGNTRRKPSRFISEMFDSDSEQPLQNEDPQQASLELFAPHLGTETIALPPHMLDNDKIVLTVSQVATWLRCPQDFYYIYILQMPIPRDPVQAYGTVVHGCIESIHRALREGKQVNLADLIKEATDNLPTEGYLTQQTRERAHKQALETIKRLHQRFTTETLPAEIEQSFRIEIPETKLIITGRIDAIYQNGSGIEIRDYKTGTSVTTADKAKKRAQSSDQLTLYALAWQLMHDEMPELLSLDFVETGQIGSVRKQPKSLETLKLKLANMTKDLEAGIYSSGTDHSFCRHPLS